jgi:putative aldouronate transport system permease protein
VAARAGRPIWMERPNLAVLVAKAVILLVVCVVMLFPFLYVLSLSLGGNWDPLAYSTSLIPQHLTFRIYREVLRGGVVLHSLEVSIGVTAVGTLVDMVMTTTMAYGLSRTGQVPGSRIVLFMALATLLFSAGIIPTYLVVRDLGLLDNYASLILPGMISAFNLVVIRQFFMNIPEEITDAAVIDGANPLQVFRHIVLPLSKAVIAVVALFYAVAIWSDYFSALLYLNNSAMWPIQMVLEAEIQNGLNPGTAATVVIATVPIVLVYPFLQRYLTQGVLSGAVKT